MGEVLDTNMTPSVMEALLQQTADKFVGKKMVIVKVEMINAKTIKFTVHRNFSSDFADRRWLPDGSYTDSDGGDTLYSEDQQLIMGENYVNPGQWIGFYTSAYMFYSKHEVIREYKSAARAKHASIIKHVAIYDSPDKLEMEVETI